MDSLPSALPEALTNSIDLASFSPNVSSITTLSISVTVEAFPLSTKSVAVLPATEDTFSAGRLVPDTVSSMPFVSADCRLLAFPSFRTLRLCSLSSLALRRSFTRPSHRAWYRSAAPWMLKNVSAGSNSSRRRPDDDNTVRPSTPMPLSCPSPPSSSSTVARMAMRSILNESATPTKSSASLCQTSSAASVTVGRGRSSSSSSS
mmetsp:Transcript_15010/g.33532  ORF Transcript_15010/g.33532 Transcript_15010/m.33532 type:complete len:204 (-) Transcript_15010:347-958(-)